MSIKFRKALAICFYFSIGVLNAQDFENMKFGQITTADFQVSAPAFDAGASAVIIKDYGNTEYIGNESGFFSIHFKRFLRVKILNKNGFNAGAFEILIPNYKSSNYAKIEDVQGSTFNQENSVIHETKLDPKSVYTQKYNRYRDIMKFTMPGLKEGSIFDLTYTIESNYFSEPPTWPFQGRYPRLWSEYEATIPSPFHYNLRTTGNDSFDIKTSKAIKQSFTIREPGDDIAYKRILSVIGTSFQYRWVKKNVPGLKEQPYISNMNNYNSRISFELEYFQQEERYEKQMQRETWNIVSRDLLSSESFGIDLNQDNHWMDEPLREITTGSLNSEEEIKKIFSYVRDNFICTNQENIYTQTPLKTVFSNRAGTVGELNLLLIALLRHQSIVADPAILSTRENGIAAADNPMLFEYNYLICVVHTPGKVYKLDASKPFNSFNRLPGECYNELGARVINKENPDLIVLSPDSISETEMTSAIFNNDDNGVSSGSVTTRFGDDHAFSVRQYVKQKSLKEYAESVQLDISNMIASNITLDSLNHPDFPLILHYDLDFKNYKQSDMIYFDPVLGSVFRKNPFEDAVRNYPVEMKSKTDYTYVLSMEVPKGFQVEELPKSARVNLMETKGSFDYLIQQSGSMIQMRVHLKLNEATFSPDEYGSIRDFFAYVVKKENEQIVFKRIQ
jgi:hypothetical protein